MAATSADSGRCPFRSASSSEASTDDEHPPTTYKIVRPPVTVHSVLPLNARFGTFVGDEHTRALFNDIGGLDRLHELFSRFYEHLFLDSELSKFVTTPEEPHAMRFASWIAEKMTKDDFWSSEAYSDGRSRQTSHSKAWRCTKREERKRGLHFKLHDCVAWMRLNFLALRESGLHEHPAFLEWYTTFIRHFIRVYEYTAPPHTDAALEWSADPERVQEYQDMEPRVFSDLFPHSA